MYSTRTTIQHHMKVRLASRQWGTKNSWRSPRQHTATTQHAKKASPNSTYWCWNPLTELHMSQLTRTASSGHFFHLCLLPVKDLYTVQCRPRCNCCKNGTKGRLYRRLRTYFFASCCTCFCKRHSSSTKIKFWASLPPVQHILTQQHTAWLNITQQLANQNMLSCMDQNE